MPLDGDFLHRDAEARGRGDDLDVPCETLLATQGKYPLPELGPRRLGAALRVEDARRDGELDSAVVGAAEELARQTLVLGDLRRGQVA